MPRFFRQQPVLPGFGPSFGFSVLFVTLVIVLPLAVLPFYTGQMSPAQFWQAVVDPRVLASYRVTVFAVACATLINVPLGLLLAWVVVRYRFPGRAWLDAAIDLPFALPTAVAGLTLSLLLSPSGWVGQWFAPWHIRLSYAMPGLISALLFTGLPYIVRAVQPVLAELDPEIEDAAASLGAGQATVVRRIVLPNLIPALCSGASQAFVRGLGEFGAVIMIAGNIPFKTEVTSLMIFNRLSEYNYPAAAAIALVLLVTSLVLLFALRAFQARLLPWQSQA